MITQNELKEILEYDKETGQFKWIVSTGRVKKGNIAGTIAKNGYIKINLKKFGSPKLAHRLAWLYMTGEFPAEQIDHINHIRNDNRWCNLRSVTRSENFKNKHRQTNNTSGVTGVSWNKNDKRWNSRISFDGEVINLGLFKQFHEAVNARKNAEVLYGYHKNHAKN